MDRGSVPFVSSVHAVSRTAASAEFDVVLLKES